MKAMFSKNNKINLYFIPGIVGATPLMPGGGTGWGGAWPLAG